MKLLFRLTLTLVSLFLIMIAVYVSLPAVLGQLIRSQLENQGFDSVQLSGLEMSSRHISIATLQMADTGRNIRLDEIQLNFRLPDLLTGEANSLRLGALEISATPVESSGFSLPDPLLLPQLLKFLLAQSPPLREFRLGHAVVYDQARRSLLSVSGALSRDDGLVSGVFQIRDSRQRHYLLDVNLQLQDVLKLQVRLPERPAERVLEMTLHTREDGRLIAGNIQADAVVLAYNPGFTDVSGSVRADFSYGAGEDPAESVFSLLVTASKLRMAEQNVSMLTLAAEGRLEMREGDGIYVAFVPASSIVVEAFEQGELSVENMTLEFPKAIRITENGLQLSENTSARLDLQDISMGEMRIASASIEPQFIRLTASQCSFGASLSLSPLSMASTQLQMQALNMLVNCPVPGQAAWSLQLDTAGISYQDEMLKVALEQCSLMLGNSRDAQLLVPGNPDELGGALSCERGPLSSSFSSGFRLNASNAVGSVDYTVSDIRPDADHPLFDSLLNDWPVPLEVVSGDIQIQGRYRWWRASGGQSRNNLRADIQLNDIGGHYEGMLFSGLIYHDSIELLPRFRSLNKAADMSIADIDIGIAISDLTSRLGFRPSSLGVLPLIELDALKMRLLGGTLTGEQLRFDLNAQQQDFDLKVQGLDLAQLVALQKMDGLSASGRLDGVIPLRITSRGLTIRDGRIFAENQGGRIQYQPSQAVGDSQQSVRGSDRVLKVLEDLRYDTLDMGVNYSEQGDLQMQLALKGISPGVDPKRPVHFNLTLEQNLLTLLRGLRYAEGINRDIDRNVQKHFQQQQQ